MKGDIAHRSIRSSMSRMVDPKLPRMISRVIGSTAHPSPPEGERAPCEPRRSSRATRRELGWSGGVFIDAPGEDRPRIPRPRRGRGEGEGEVKERSQTLQEKVVRGVHAGVETR